MTPVFDETADFVIIGSGGGALAAALAAAHAGLSVVVLEKQTKFGGSTAMSGGVLWLPGNPLHARAGYPDTIDAARYYLNSLIKPSDTASTSVRRDAFLRAVAPMVTMLEAAGLRFYACNRYPDYYSGGSVSGRAIGAKCIFAQRLGDDAEKLMLLPGWNMPIATDEFAPMSLAARTLKGKLISARVAIRVLRQKLAGSPLLFRGAALQARMLLAVRAINIDLRADSAVTGLVSVAGRVTGVRARSHGTEQTIGARRGVLLASGGFSRNAALRKTYQPAPAGTGWTMANPGDTGDLIAEAQAQGAVLRHMDESWWVPVSLKANGQIAGFHSPQEMQKPYCIAVNAKGARFVNEAASYMEIGQAMYAHGGVPAWIIMDARHRRYYPWGAVPPLVTPASWIKSGYLARANTLAELASQCGIDSSGLERSVARFNEFAKTGNDLDFQRGARAYDLLYADPRVKPNPALGPIEQAPFYAVRIVPGDVGTAGGLMTDEHARVLRAGGGVIPGLYACGNASAPLFGRIYPGPGASIAASFVFGYIAALHAAGTNT